MTDTPETPKTPSSTPETPLPDGDKGAGSKDALKADLAAERDKRQALETQVAELNKFRDGLAGLFGAKPDELTPERLAARLEESERASAERSKQLAVFSSVPAGVDAGALLDSRAFNAELAKVKSDNPAAIQKVVQDFLKANPRFGSPTPDGMRDARVGDPGAGLSPQTVDDWLRGQR